MNTIYRRAYRLCRAAIGRSVDNPIIDIVYSVRDSIM
jgi:hypothetical protein